MKLAIARIWGTKSAVLVPHSDEPVSLMRPDTTIVFSGAVEIRSGDVWRAAGCLFSTVDEPCKEVARMDLDLQGRVALVMAASKGLGRAVATELAREGASVVISSRDGETLARTAAEIADETGAEVEPHTADITRAEDVRALVSHAADRFGGLDALVNNTGGPPAGTFDDFGDEDWQAAFELILLSLIRAVREAWPLMRERGGGRIVNVASSSIKQPIENLTLSNTFRAGIAGLAKSLSAELAPDGILINTLGPGRISTARSRSMDAARAETLGVPVEEVRGQVETQIPLGRYGTPEEFARVAAFLASPANSYVTGQAILVDGGMVRAL